MPFQNFVNRDRLTRLSLAKIKLLVITVDLPFSSPTGAYFFKILLKLSRFSI
jgi:hypothetical protein